MEELCLHSLEFTVPRPTLETRATIVRKSRITAPFSKVIQVRRQVEPFNLYYGGGEGSTRGYYSRHFSYFLPS